MENSKIETKLPEKTGDSVEQFRDLTDLQLSLIGGGIGDVHFG